MIMMVDNTLSEIKILIVFLNIFLITRDVRKWILISI